MRCLGCEAENRDIARYCRMCGHPIAGPSAGPAGSLTAFPTLDAESAKSELLIPDVDLALADPPAPHFPPPPSPPSPLLMSTASQARTPPQDPAPPLPATPGQGNRRRRRALQAVALAGSLVVAGTVGYFVGIQRLGVAYTSEQTVATKGPEPTASPGERPAGPATAAAPAARQPVPQAASGPPAALAAPSTLPAAPRAEKPAAATATAAPPQRVQPSLPPPLLGGRVANAPPARSPNAGASNASDHRGARGTDFSAAAAPAQSRPVFDPAPVAAAAPSDWHDALKEALGRCRAGSNFLTRTFCEEKAKFKYCGPGNRWGSVPECPQTASRERQ